MRLLDKIDGHLYRSLLYADELTPHEDLGRLVLIIDAMELDPEGGDPLTTVRLGVVAPDLFEQVDAFAEMFGETVQEDDVWDRARAAALFQAIVDLESSEELTNLGPDLEAYVQKRTLDQGFIDLIIGEHLSSDEARKTLRLGPEDEVLDLN